MMKGDDECIEMLNANAEVKVDGGSFIQNLIMNQTIPPNPTSVVQVIRSQQMINTLKDHGVEVSFIDPVTFEEYKL
jgi:hypothetical protein